MDIKELDKRQMVLLTLLITFVVSIATGIVTVSLMNQAPKSVPYTVNNVIQRTIEKVSTVTEDKNEIKKEESSDGVSISKEGDILIKIYKNEINESNIVGDGVLISDTGLLLVDSNILNITDKYIISLDSQLFDIKVIKKFINGFSILQISEKTKTEDIKTDNPKNENKEDLSGGENNQNIQPVDNITQ